MKYIYLVGYVSSFGINREVLVLNYQIDSYNSFLIADDILRDKLKQRHAKIMTYQLISKEDNDGQR